jgi:hypothetical protein
MSQLDHKEKSIDGVNYRVRMLDPLTANDILVDLLKVVGPSLGAVASGAMKDKDGVEKLLDGLGEDAVGSESLERAIVSLVDRMQKPQLRDLINTLSGVTEVQVGGNWPALPEIFAVHFRGKLWAMYRWLGFALWAQYGFSSTAGGATSLRDLLSALRSRGPTPTT